MISWDLINNPQAFSDVQHIQIYTPNKGSYKMYTTILYMTSIIDVIYKNFTYTIYT